MSFIATAWAWAQRTGDPASKLVLVALADHHNPSVDLAWPKIEIIADRAEVSVRTAQRKLGELEACGYIQRIARYDADGFQASNGYKLLMDKGCQSDTPNDYVGCQIDTPGVTLLSPLEPLTEKLEKQDGACARGAVDNSADELPVVGLQDADDADELPVVGLQDADDADELPVVGRQVSPDAGQTAVQVCQEGGPQRTSHRRPLPGRRTTAADAPRWKASSAELEAFRRMAEGGDL